MDKIMIKDNKGRIKYLEKNVHLGTGHSVCNSCGKDMPGVWNVVCRECWGTFCYDCSIVVENYWYCKKHAPNRKSNMGKIFNMKNKNLRGNCSFCGKPLRGKSGLDFMDRVYCKRIWCSIKESRKGRKWRSRFKRLYEAW